MILCDKSIRRASAFLTDRGQFELTRLQPASYDVTLGNQFRRMVESPGHVQPWVDPEDPDTYSARHYVETTVDRAYELYPGRFVLAHTVEDFTIPANVQSQVCGKSSLGRLGLFVENAGFVDPGFSGQLTLELFNCSSRMIVLRPGMRIAQVSFHKLDEPAACPYGCRELGSHYQHQKGATASRGSF